MTHKKPLVPRDTRTQKQKQIDQERLTSEPADLRRGNLDGNMNNTANQIANSGAEPAER